MANTYDTGWQDINYLWGGSKQYPSAAQLANMQFRYMFEVTDASWSAQTLTVKSTWNVRTKSGTFDLQNDLSNGFFESYINVTGIFPNQNPTSDVANFPVHIDTNGARSNGSSLYGFSRTHTLKGSQSNPMALLAKAQFFGWYNDVTQQWGLSSSSTMVNWAPTMDPNQPTGVTAKRNNDSQATISWTANSTDSQYIAGFNVLRSANGGSYVQIATNVAGSARSYIDRSVSANNYYSYQIVAVNARGSAVSFASNTIYNTPGDPSSPTAIASSGTSVRVSWTDRSNGKTGVQVYRSTDGGSTWPSDPLAVLGGGKIEYIDNNPPEAQLRYRVHYYRESVSTDPEYPSVLRSPGAITNVVVPMQPPLAPTVPQIGPNIGVNVPSIRFSWTHNPVDGTGQTQAAIEVSFNGGSTWTSIANITGSTNYYDWVPTGNTDGQVVQYRIRTRGLSSSYGPYSPVQSFTFRSVPVITITNPPSDGWALELLPYQIVWTYDNNYPMASCDVTLTDLETNRVVIRWTSINDNILSVQTFFPVNGKSYRVDVSATSTVSQTSTDSRTFVVDYILPEIPITAGWFSTDDFKVHITIEAPESVPAISYMFFTRVMPDGEEIMMYDQLSPDVGETQLIDNTPMLNTDNVYRSYSYSAQGTIDYYELHVYADSGRFYVFNHGENFGLYIPLIANLTYDENGSRTANTYAIAGREYPVEFRGENYSEKLTLTADLVNLENVLDSEELYQSLRALRRSDTDIMLRTPNGAITFTMVPQLAFKYGGTTEWRAASITTEEVDTATNYTRRVRR